MKWPEATFSPGSIIINAHELADSFDGWLGADVNRLKAIQNEEAGVLLVGAKDRRPIVKLLKQEVRKMHTIQLRCLLYI